MEPKKKGSQDPPLKPSRRILLLLLSVGLHVGVAATAIIRFYALTVPGHLLNKSVQAPSSQSPACPTPALPGEYKNSGDNVQRCGHPSSTQDQLEGSNDFVLAVDLLLLVVLGSLSMVISILIYRDVAWSCQAPPTEKYLKIVHKYYQYTKTAGSSDASEADNVSASKQRPGRTQQNVQLESSTHALAQWTVAASIDGSINTTEWIGSPSSAYEISLESHKGAGPEHPQSATSSCSAGACHGITTIPTDGQSAELEKGAEDRNSVDLPHPKLCSDVGEHSANYNYRPDVCSKSLPGASGTKSDHSSSRAMQHQQLQHQMHPVTRVDGFLHCCVVTRDIIKIPTERTGKTFNVSSFGKIL
eukprot:scpid82899/ scgid1256/ 